MKVVCTIEARMGSTRLPGKMMKDLVDGKSTLEVMVERLKHTTRTDEIVVATTEKSRDDVLAEEASRLDVGCFRGSEEDVLGRVLNAGKAYDADVICETTGDCPLHDPGIIDQVIGCYHDNPWAEYVSNILVRRYPDGLDVEVFDIETLQTVADTTDEPEYREHVPKYVRDYRSEFDVINVSPPPALDDNQLRITLDYEADLELIRELLARLEPGFDAYDIVELLESDPELRAINEQHVDVE